MGIQSDGPENIYLSCDIHRALFEADPLLCTTVCATRDTAIAALEFDYGWSSQTPYSPVAIEYIRCTLLTKFWRPFTRIGATRVLPTQRVWLRNNN